MLPTLENLLLEVSKSSLIDKGDMNEAEELILHSLLKGLSIKRAGIWMLDEASSSIRCSLQIDLHHQTHGEDMVLTRDQYPRYFQALDSERAIAAHDARSHSATREFTEGYLEPLGITSLLDLPIRHRGNMVGIVCCEHIGKPRVWTEDELTFSAALADLVGRAISAKERDDYARQLEQTNQSLEQLVNKRTASLEQTLETLKMAQQQLIENEKMASLGSLVSGVAHEVNTPLGIAVTGASHCQYLLTTLNEAVLSNTLSKKAMQSKLSNMGQSLKLVNDNLQRAAELIQNFKKTAVDQHNLALTDFELSDYVHIVMSSLMPLLKTRQVKLDLQAPGSFAMHSYPGALAQILTNLANNACTHAFDNGQDNQIQVRIRPHNGQQVEILFVDNGKGMEEGVLKQIFLPFFTTKRGQGGSGLGLSICYNLATAKLKGSIKAESHPGQGSCFRLTLPTRVDAEAGK
ncbi:sensor histidine kinase [Bowmanella dokdonensis]|uniref:histidine kinase n=1 Tax=Bowmanella dokdonensis TaxID=751969 RepID=A0A939DLQ2_9ALTE|nr:GAF domain-containing sensor histidine kinase [Bowmanella dokdonensis]MBN7824151.1 GAF domain-containing sensor histidine kinase [Bowmanella dokdonensis]